NDQQPYEIHIASPTRVESFIVFFPRGWAEQALDSLTVPPEKLLDEPQSRREQPVHFFERFSEHDELVSPALGTLRRAHKNGQLRLSFAVSLFARVQGGLSNDAARISLGLPGRSGEIPSGTHCVARNRDLLLCGIRELGQFQFLVQPPRRCVPARLAKRKKS